MLMRRSRSHAARGAVLTTLLVLGSACSLYVGGSRPFSPEELRRDPHWVAVTSVPYVHQATQRDCAAAIAMVMGYWNGPPGSAEALRTFRDPKGPGIRVAALRDFARRQGLEAFVFEGRLQDLYNELRKQRPVIVGVAKNYLTKFLAH